MPSPRTGTATTWTLAVLILAVATALRVHDVGRLSFWYDEVVTVRLARAATPGALLRLLREIDATRAPLHPLLLQGWVKAFGPSEASARAFSVACGVLTVALVGRIGRRAFGDPRTGLYAAWFAAISPLLVLYAREARMYAWLVLVTSAAWDALLTVRDRPSAASLALYAFWLAALVYSHPLGLLMAAALAAASLVVRRAAGVSWGRWFFAHAAAALAVAPWVGRYFDHEPESTVGRLPLAFLLGMPIGFIGGNFLTLLGFVVLIGFGLVSLRRVGSWRLRPSVDAPVSGACLLVWLIVPPVLLYGYSRLSHPVFGPARYTLYVAPAYLILVARGLAKLPRWAGLVAAAAASALAVAAWPGLIYAPDLKADWRAAAARLDRVDASRTEPVVVVSADPWHNVEVEVARYYLNPPRPAFALPADPRGLAAVIRTRFWVAVGVRDGVLATDPARMVRLRRDAELIDVPGLRLISGGSSVNPDRSPTTDAR